MTKRYGDVVAVRDFSLDIEAGEFVSILGQSGSGKTTVLRLIAGLETPTAGELLIGGLDATHLVPEARELGMVFQDYALFPHMSVWDNVAFPLRMRRVKRRELEGRVREAMELVNLHGLERRRPAQLSGGQQQRVALARALVFGPKVLLLDEPLSALDKNLREYMKAELQALHRRVGTTVVYVTHDQSEALALSSRIVVMNHGRIEGVDAPDRLYRTPASRYIAGFIGDANMVDGEVIAVDEAAVSVSSPVGQWGVPMERVRSPRVPCVGEPATIMLRPECILVASHGLAREGVLRVPCEVKQALYAGSSVIYVLETLQSGTVLTARCEQREEKLLSVGDRVQAELLTGRAVLFEGA